MLQEKEIECFGQCAESCRTEQLGCDCVGVGVATPDNTEILKYVWINVCS